MNLPLPVRVLLWPLSALYGALARLRAWLYASGWLKQKRLRGVVISVGNLTVGGTGKTPMVLWLAERFLARGKRVAILSRGYRGIRGASDEVALLQNRLRGRAAFGVGKNRFKEGRRLEEQGIDVFLLDDGFQHLRLARDLDIVLVDASRPIQRETYLPGGRLREPISALNRADIAVMTRASAHTSPEVPESRPYSIFYARARLLGFRGLESKDLHFVSQIGPGPFFAFCGIGNPQAFFFDLQRWRINLAGRLEFPDHHRYSGADVHRLEKKASQSGATALVTTEKDAWNLDGLRSSSIPVFVAVIEMEPNSESEFMAAVERTLAKRRGASA